MKLFIVFKFIATCWETTDDKPILQVLKSDIFLLGQGIPYDCNSLMHYTERAFASSKVS